MKKLLAGLVIVVVGVAVFHFATLPPAPPEIPPVPAKIATPAIPALTAYDMPTGQVPVSSEPYGATFRSVSIADLVERNMGTGVYTGTPYWTQRKEWFEKNFYATLAGKKVWKPGTSPDTHKRGDPVTWEFVPIPQYVPPPCDQVQPTGYDAEGCRYVNALFKDVEAVDKAKAQRMRDQVRRGRDVWFKGTFGNQDENTLATIRIRGIGKEKMNYPWLDTRTRSQRFTKWGLINDPDCVEGDESTHWYDKCQDPHSSGVLGYRKYYADPIKQGDKVIYDPATAPYDPNEIKENKRYVIGHPCVQCHVGFEPTRPPADGNAPKWENLSGTIGAQHIRQPLAFFGGLPSNHYVPQVVKGGRLGTVDTSLVASDFMHNPGTQNNIMDFHNKRLFEHKMRDPVSGEIKTAKTRHVLKGGEDSVGEHLALIRVYINIGLCTEECWVPNFPYPGQMIGRGSKQSPMRIMQCAAKCDAWNYADSKMDDLTAFLITGGPTYLMAAKETKDGTPGAKYVDTTMVPAGKAIFARECAGCHSSKFAPENIRADKNALGKFYEGHVFGKEDYWRTEFTEAQLADKAFVEKYFVKDAKLGLRPKQFAEKGVFGQDWLGNDERTNFKIVGTNMCRALHDNHSKGHIWEEFGSETYRDSPPAGTVKRVVNRMFPLIGGMEMGEKTIDGGSGYLRNISLLSVWAIAPFLHNNAVGEMTYLPDGSPDYTVAGRIKQFEMAFDELMTSDNPAATPHRTPKTSTFTEDSVVSAREDGHGFPQIPVKAGTPVANAASSDTHDPFFMKCDDPVENKGHQFGIDLSAADKRALREFLKMM